MEGALLQQRKQLGLESMSGLGFQRTDSIEGKTLARHWKFTAIRCWLNRRVADESFRCYQSQLRCPDLGVISGLTSSLFTKNKRAVFGWRAHKVPGLAGV